MIHTILAYLDPGAGSIVIQSIVAGILGFVVALKVFWSRIVAFFVRSSRKKGDAAVSTENKPIG